MQTPIFLASARARLEILRRMCRYNPQNRYARQALRAV